MNIKKLMIIIFVIALIILNISNAQYYTYNTVEVNESKYSVKLGLWSAKLTGDAYAPSNNFTVDFENDLGFGNTKSFVTFDFNYRLSNLNGVGFSFFSGEHKAVKNLTRTITLPGDPNDVTFNVNTNLFSEIKYSAFDIFYRRYFSSEQNYDFYGLIGIRFNNLKGDFVGRDNVGNVIGSVAFSVNVPTTYLGIGGNFNLSNNFSVSYQIQGLTLSFSGNKVNTIEYQLSLGYDFTQNWGINIGYRYNNTKGEDDLSRSLKVKYQGLIFGISGRF